MSTYANVAISHAISSSYNVNVGDDVNLVTCCGPRLKFCRFDRFVVIQFLDRFQEGGRWLRGTVMAAHSEVHSSSCNNRSAKEEANDRGFHFVLINWNKGFG